MTDRSDENNCTKPLRDSADDFEQDNPNDDKRLTEGNQETNDSGLYPIVIAAVVIALGVILTRLAKQFLVNGFIRAFGLKVHSDQQLRGKFY